MGFIRFSGLSILWCGYCVLVGQSLKLMSSSVGLRPSLLTSSPVNYAVRRHSTQYLRAFAPAVAAEAPPTVCVSPFEAIDKSPKHRLTALQLATMTGTTVSQSHKQLQQLAYEAAGKLEVTESGDLVYTFPTNYKSRLSQYSRSRQLQIWFGANRARLYRVFRGTICAVTYGLFVSLVVAVSMLGIVVAAAANADKKSDSSSNKKKDKDKDKSKESDRSTSYRHHYYYHNYPLNNKYFFYSNNNNYNNRYNNYNNAIDIRKIASGASNWLTASIIAFIFGSDVEQPGTPVR
jgi:hypothetical protein